MMKTLLVALAVLGGVACAPLPPGVGVTVDEPGFGLAIGTAARGYYAPGYYAPPAAYVPPPVFVERRVYVPAPRFDRGRRWERPRWARRGYRD